MRRSRPRWLVYVLVIAGLLAVALVARWLATGGAAKNAKAGRPPAAVAVASVEVGDMPETVNEIGTVTPIDTATVHSQLSGYVMGILFKEGQMVTQGQPIVQVDQRPYDLALAQAQGTLAKDSSTLVSAKLDLKRYQTLSLQDSVARQTLDTQRATVGQLEGTIAADRAAVGTARLNIQYSTIKAPFTGRIGLKQVSVGSYVTPGDTSGVAVVTRIDPIDVVFSLPQADLASVQRKAGTAQGLPVTILDQDNKTVLAHGKFSTFDNQIDTTTGTVKAKARVANPATAGATGEKAPLLFPNQFVNVTMLVDTLHQVTIVPVSALRHGAQGDFVFVVQPDKTVKIRIVRMGPSDGVRTAILSGLSKGETVVSEGADGLDDGSAVRLPEGKGKGGSHRKQGGADAQ